MIPCNAAVKFERLSQMLAAIDASSTSPVKQVEVWPNDVAQPQAVLRDGKPRPPFPCYNRQSLENFPIRVVSLPDTTPKTSAHHHPSRRTEHVRTSTPPLPPPRAPLRYLLPSLPTRTHILSLRLFTNHLHQPPSASYVPPAQLPLHTFGNSNLLLRPRNIALRTHHSIRAIQPKPQCTCTASNPTGQNSRSGVRMVHNDGAGS